jgi:1,2-diacylglycerol 3-alpha-glucosyltransferase
MISDSFFEHQLYQENHFANEYVRRGFDLTVITSTFTNLSDYYNDRYDANSKACDSKISGYRLIRLPYAFNFFNKLRKLKRITSYLEQAAPDLIFIHDIQFNIHEAVDYIKRQNRKVRLVLDFHADFSNSAKNIFSKIFIHRICKGLYFRKYEKWFDAILPIVPDGMNFLNKLYGTPVKRMELFPLGVDTFTSATYRNETSRKAMRDRLSIQYHALVIFTGGKLEPRKKTEELIETVIGLKDRNVHLIIVGDFVSCPKEYSDSVRSLISSSGNITLVGWVPSSEVYEYMSACDIAIFPSSQSVLWQQSIGMGLPLVVGKYVTLDDGRQFDQKVEYLNFKNNLVVLNAQNDRRSEIKTAITTFLDPKVLKAYRENTLWVANEYLSYTKLADRTLAV